MIRFRPGAVLAAALLCAVVLHAGQAWAAAEIHRLNLVISGMPSQVDGDGFNDAIQRYNDTVLGPVGYEPLDKLQFGWQFQSELRYFIRPNVSVNAGLSHLRVQSKREFLPGLTQAVNVRAELLTVPVHLGASYYMQPYNQGDFQARAFFGGGLLSYTHSRFTLEQVMTNPDTTLTERFGESFRITGTQDAPGYYVEGGVHMFFALRYSVLLSAFYRAGDISGVIDEDTGLPLLDADGKPLHVDVSGVGARLGVAIGF